MPSIRLTKYIYFCYCADDTCASFSELIRKQNKWIDDIVCWTAKATKLCIKIGGASIVCQEIQQGAPRVLKYKYIAISKINYKHCILRIWTMVSTTITQWMGSAFNFNFYQNSILIRLRPFYIHIYLMNGWINTIETFFIFLRKIQT